MNVNDFDNKLPEGDKLIAIFNRQKELIEKYHLIEQFNLGIPISTIPYDLNDKRNQHRIKDFAWRVTEELTEATECLGQQDKTHFLEELIDALHFMVELLINVGVTPEALIECQGDKMDYLFSRIPKMEDMTYTTYLVIESLGLAMNCLKNKPWKQTNMLTDEEAFYTKLIKAFFMLIELLISAGLTAETATIMYFNKSDVNRFRIRSQY